MKDYDLTSAIRGLAVKTNGHVGVANWYLFGSAQERFSNASDIDVLARISHANRRIGAPNQRK
jgi:predicted nucleotidyltransferase